MSKRKMSLQDACDIVPDDLPDGAYWAMAHEIAGAEFGDAWDELDADFLDVVSAKPKVMCNQCARKFYTVQQRDQHVAQMIKNGKHRTRSSLRCHHSIKEQK